MFGWSLTRKRKSETPLSQEGPSPVQRLRRLEIEIATIREDLDLQTMAQKKLTGRVAGLIGVPARQRLREADTGNHGGTETLEEYRERMRREGRLSAVAEPTSREGSRQ